MDTAPPPQTPTNIPEYAVSELAGAIRRTLEGAFGRVRVRGEITECKRYPSGHVYLSLKDENAKIESVIWKTSLRALSLQPENGVEVIATGRISTYADRSKYQLVIDRLEYAGEGALLARIEALRKKLLAEGLFEEARKRRLPMLPQVIGVVTSERGAVIQDIRTTIARRFPRRLLLWPVPVQGNGAAERIAAAIRGFGALPERGRVPRPDVIIVARGGGSLEDLMAFNEEVVVRAAAASPIPLISAVGHETDTTLIDYASDRRAPTPTAAAELAVPARTDLLAALAQTTARLNSITAHAMNAARLRLVRVERRMPDLPARVADYRRRLDEAGEWLPEALLSLLRRKREGMSRLHLPHPREGIAARRGHVALLGHRMEHGWARLLHGKTRERPLLAFSAAPVQSMLREKRARLEGCSARLESVSYQSVLDRGFALARNEKGEPLTRAAAVAPGSRLSLVFSDGSVGATADGGSSGRSRQKAEPRQGALL
jgi:exodeoxyribonuclease VII large subunit